jgi:predicted aminopeptidase
MIFNTLLQLAKIRSQIINAFISVMALLVLSACNPIFVMQAAYEQSKILAGSRPIQEVIADPSTASEDKLKLCLVEKTREFTKAMTLEPGDTFTSYTELDRDPVAWVVSASSKDAFAIYTWWFPIVGSIPYRGYFDKEDAIAASAKLEEKGFETWVRGTAAFSTLGWFNDPLLSSTLKLSTSDVVSTVIHETVHATIWISGSVAFNESLANFVGSRATIDFYKWLKTVEGCPLSEEARLKLQQEAELEFQKVLDISDSFSSLYEALTQLYGSEIPSEQKISERNQILALQFAGIRAKYPTLKFMSQVNNAEIMQRKLYLTQLRNFDKLFVKDGSDWTRFMGHIRELAKEPGEGEQGAFLKLETLNK